MARPLYLVFAGVNGAGKPTFYHAGFWRQPDVERGLPRVNADEILRELGGDVASKAALLVLPPLPD